MYNCLTISKKKEILLYEKHKYCMKHQFCCWGAASKKIHHSSARTTPLSHTQNVAVVELYSQVTRKEREINRERCYTSNTNIAIGVEKSKSCVQNIFQNFTWIVKIVIISWWDFDKYLKTIMYYGVVVFFFFCFFGKGKIFLFYNFSRTLLRFWQSALRTSSPDTFCGYFAVFPTRCTAPLMRVCLQDRDPTIPNVRRCVIIRLLHMQLDQWRYFNSIQKKWAIPYWIKIQWILVNFHFWHHN